jgi:hypothetical protein
MSEVKVNKISPRTACGTVTLGDSGDTFTIPSGATITNNGTAAGFGATGAASWDTTVKTSGFTAVSGVGYFVNTTAGAISVNLPAGTAGDVVAIKDYANTFDSNAVTLVQNGSDKIGGSTVNATLSTEGLAVTLVFVDSTQGWLVTDNGTQDTAPTAQYVTATGGTITCSGDYRIHTFTGPGALCVSNAGNAAGSNTVDYLVVAGGGGGGWDRAGGGGAGGFRESPGTASGSYSVSPLGTSPAVALSVPVASYPIAVGGGGTNGNDVIGRGVNGSNSSFSSITSAGGGGGGAAPCSQAPGLNGGSGGGTSGPSSSAGSGNTPPVSPSQGFPGGIAPAPGGQDHGAGGGGATAAGVPGAGTSPAGAGGAGATTSINASPTAYAGGGGGGFSNGAPGCAPFGGGVGGAGGGGAGGPYPGGLGSAGTINTGGGGGGGSNGPNSSPAGNGGGGGSGIVVIRYKFQN